MAAGDFPSPIRVASLKNLKDAWGNSRSLSRGRTAGVDGITPGYFRQALETNLQTIRNQLIKGSYRFSKLRPIGIPKQDGRVRLICVPSVSDRLVQRLAVNYVASGDRLRVQNTVSYGFIKGRGVGDAVKRAKNLRNEYPWAFKSDIASFFDRIERPQLKQALKTRLGRSSIIPILFAAIDCEIDISDPDDARTVRVAGIKEGVGLRQGMPLSPLLSNYVLRDFDRYFEKKGAKLVRYADDFLLLAGSRDECEVHFHEVRNLLRQINHEVPEPGPSSKTVICNPNEEVEFLGFSISPNADGNRYRILAPELAFETIKKKMERFHQFDYVKSNYGKLTRVISKINSIGNGFVNAYSPAKNFPDLRSHAINCRSQAYKELFASIFGQDVLEGLDDARREFLELGGPLNDSF